MSSRANLGHSFVLVVMFVTLATSKPVPTIERSSTDGNISSNSNNSSSSYPTFPAVPSSYRLVLKVFENDHSMPYLMVLQATTTTENQMKVREDHYYYHKQEEVHKAYHTSIRHINPKQQQQNVQYVITHHHENHPAMCFETNVEFKGLSLHAFASGSRFVGRTTATTHVPIIAPKPNEGTGESMGKYSSSSTDDEDATKDVAGFESHATSNVAPDLAPNAIPNVTWVSEKLPCEQWRLPLEEQQGSSRKNNDSPFADICVRTVGDDYDRKWISPVAIRYPYKRFDVLQFVADDAAGRDQVYNPEEASSVPCEPLNM